MIRKIIFIFAVLIYILTIVVLIIPYEKQLINNDYAPKKIVYEEQQKENQVELLRKYYSNDDIIGILNIKNTDFSVPLLQGEDNYYYLKHGPNKEKKRSGSIFLDYRVELEKNKKLIIYGHNSSSLNMPFKILENYYDKEYFNNHKYIEIVSEKEIKTYEIFSIFVEVEDFSYMEIDFNDKSYLTHINSLKNKSMFKSNINLDSDDEILILQTCSTHRDYSEFYNKYLLIISRRVYDEKKF